MELGVEANEMQRGQAEIWQHLFSFVDSMTIKCAVELRIADIINSQNGPLTLSQIASHISGSTSPNIPYLERIMRSLVRKKIFTAHHSSDGGETLYGLTYKSRWLLWESKPSLVPLILFENHPLPLAAWHYLSDCIRHGGFAFDKAHGCDIWGFASTNSEFNRLFNDAMACNAQVAVEALLGAYKDGFESIGSLVDVGGGTGQIISDIVKAHPHIIGINFDLPHVISTAPAYTGVTHVAGDMFDGIPSADAIFIKWVLHDWSHEQCVKILKNCRKSIPEKTGKIIIMDVVMEPLESNDDDVFAEVRSILDMAMIAHTTGGKERTELEWKKMLEEAGFPTYKITKTPAIPSIIEAKPV